MSEEEKYEQLRQVCLSYKNENEYLWKKISDLEAKLAESERKNFELLTKLNLKEYAPAFCTLADRDCEALGQVKKLKQQLHDLPKKIVGEIRKEIEFPLYVHPDFDEFECLFDIDKLLDTILKKYEGVEK